MSETLLADAQFFDSMIDLIPQNYYAPNRETKNKFHVNTKQVVQEESNKANSKRGKKLKETATEAKTETTADNQEPVQTAPVPTGATGEMTDLKTKLQQRLQALSNKRKPEPSKADRSVRKKQKKESKKAERKIKKESQAKKIAMPKPVKQAPPPPKPEPEVLDFQFGEVKDAVNLLAPVQRKTGKLEKALKQIEKFESKVERAQEQGLEAAQQLVKEKAVSTAMLRAKGVKVRDDKKLIKKSLKKVQTKKKKSAKEWGERISNVAKQMKKVAGKRKENIDKKIKDRKEKKLKKMKRK